MTRRILSSALAAAALMAGVLGGAANADVALTPTAPVTAPDASVAVATPTATPTAIPSPSATATSSPVAAAPTAAPTESATPEATPTSTATPAATPTTAPVKQRKHHTRAKANRKRGGTHAIRECKPGKHSTKKHPCYKRKSSDDSSSTGSTGTTAGDDATTTDTSTPAVSASDVPTSGPVASTALAGAGVGIPNFFISKFQIPPFLLPIYQAAGIQYGIRWEVLAGINAIETDYGRNLNVSSAGALGWMQFMPATWQQYGVDANGDGVKDPYNPVDAIFASARYLKAAGGDKDIRKGIFAYNHADWYVDEVLQQAQVAAALPNDLVDALTGLTQGRFPLRGRTVYKGKLSTTTAYAKANKATVAVESSHRKTTTIYGRAGAPAVAVNDGKVVKIGNNRRLGRYIVVQDVYGNTFTYGNLAKVAQTYPSPKRQTTKSTRKHSTGAKAKTSSRKRSTRKAKASTRKHTVRAKAKATARKHTSRKAKTASRKRTAKASAATSRRGAGSSSKSSSDDGAAAADADKAATVADSVATGSLKQRLFAHPTRTRAATAGGDLQVTGTSAGAPLGLDPADFVAKRMRVGAKVLAGTVIGRIGRTHADTIPHLVFEIRPAGQGAPRIDPKPILDGWRLLESTNVYRAKATRALLGETGAKQSSTIGQTLLMSKSALARRVLADDRITITGCNVADIRAGAIDRRVLATLEFLADNGLNPTVTAMRCDHGLMTSSGNVSEHSTGTAVDIGAINGIRIQPSTQGAGTITETTIKKLLTLQGTMKPHQIISLMTFQGADNTLSMSDHADHIHIGFRPQYGENRKVSKQVDQILKPGQWTKLMDRISSLDNPTVRTNPSKYAIKVKKADTGRGGD